MEVKVGFQVRQAGVKDQQQIASLIHFETYIHRHLDWRNPIDWLGKQPFYVAIQDYRLVAAFACPPDPPQVAWIRLFTCSDWSSLQDTWLSLWEAARSELLGIGGFTVAGITLQAWYRDLLRSSGFQNMQEIVMLEWTYDNRKNLTNAPGMVVRMMAPADLETVARVDTAAFPPLWQNSLEALRHAYSQSAVATVAELDGMIVGYQISTKNPVGGHLARLAVRPEAQGKGVGAALVNDLLERGRRRGFTRLSVNTQSDNTASMNLYRKLGFRQTGEHYPVYTYQIP